MFKQLKKLQNDSQGFTLVELMIVVAIIGILAAIAIPQFATYRIKGFNTSALSDLRNTVTQEAGMFSDFQTFGISGSNIAIASPMAYGAAAGGAGALITGPAAANSTHVLRATVNAVNRGVNIGLSNQNSVEARTEAIVLPGNPRAASFIVTSKHLNGNTYYAQDSDIELIYQDVFDGSNGTILAVGATAASTQGADDIATTNGPSGQAWAIK